MKFLKIIALIIAILFLLFCLAGSQRAWFGIIIFIVGLFLHKQFRKGRIQFSKSRYIIIFGLLSAFILALTSPADTKPVKQTASEAKAEDTAVKADEKKAEEEKAKVAEKKKEEAAAAKLAEQKKQEEARKEAEAKKQAEQKRLEEEAKKQAEQKRLEEEAKKQAEQKRLEDERKKKEQEQAEAAAAQEAERKRKEQEAAEAAAAAEPVQSTETFDNCTEMRKVHPKGVPSSHPAYESQHDRDKDNWACER